MRSALVDGRLPDPRSLGEARRRHEQLVHEIGRIDHQLDDLAAEGKHPDRDAYLAWRAKAHRARRYMADEARQLAFWIDAHPEASLLREARDVLTRLHEDITLDASERAVLARLEVACAPAPLSQKATGG